MDGDQKDSKPSNTQNPFEAVDKFIEEKRQINDSLNEQDFGSRTSGYDHPQGHIRSYIVDNQDGALARFTSKKKDPAAEDYVEQCLRNLESHLDVVPPVHYPSDVYARLKVLEDKIMRMEELYPQISAHLLNYQDTTGSRSGGRVTRAPGFYKELRIVKKKKKSRRETPIGIEMEAAHASELLKNKMAELKNKLMK